MGRRLRRFRENMREKVKKFASPDVKQRVFSEIGDDKPKILCADIIMISGCNDSQTSADVSNVS